MKRPSKTLESEAELYAAALNLLARREHSALELQHKLAQRGGAAATIAQVVQTLQAEGWQDDARFAEVYASSRFDKGYGPLRLRRDLQQCGVADIVVTAVLADFADQWSARLQRLRRRRFGESLPTTPAEQARQIRFLRQRGYTMDQIMPLFKPTETDS